MIPRPLLLALALLLAAAPARAGERVQVPTGDARPTTAEDLRPQPASGATYNEAWTYLFVLEGGMTASLRFSLAHFGRLRGPVSGAELALANFDGESYRAAKEYDASDLSFAAATQRLRVHPDIFAEGPLPQRHRVRFKAEKHGVPYELDLTFSEIAPGLTWGDGVFRLGRERIGMFIHIPYARVEGAVRVGDVTKRVSGTAYMDHTFQTDYASRLVRSAFRYVQHGGGAEAGTLLLPASGFEDRPIGFAAVREGGRFRLRTPEAVEVVSARRALGVEVPRQLLVRFEGGGQTILNREADQQAFSSLEELGGLQRAVVRRLLGGEPLAFRGRGTTNRGRPFAYDFLVVK